MNNRDTTAKTLEIYLLNTKGTELEAGTADTQPTAKFDDVLIIENGIRGYGGKTKTRNLWKRK